MPRRSPWVAGLDLGARRLHWVAIDARGQVRDAATLATLDDLIDRAARTPIVAIDAPDAPSRAPHADNLRLPLKFRSARCGEIALGLQRRIWVPWTTPAAPPFPGWMLRGFEAHARLRAVGVTTLETYPHAAFLTWNAGVRPPPKQSRAGRITRADLLRAAGLAGHPADSWPHDLLDAAAAALVARHHLRGEAVAVTCGHDGSAIWLPP
ncbi:MAG: hypothetical protein KatS3mg108_1500 [Isosphaeraceae bacterium]|jgi:predicted nuclease with RNAse H fold|nr:MAG: hypothetical protein KatS3mg108_1500 [Isosphaeraceae bacterium]